MSFIGNIPEWNPTPGGDTPAKWTPPPVQPPQEQPSVVMPTAAVEGAGGHHAAVAQAVAAPPAAPQPFAPQPVALAQPLFVSAPAAGQPAAPASVVVPSAQPSVVLPTPQATLAQSLAATQPSTASVPVPPSHSAGDAPILFSAWTGGNPSTASVPVVQTWSSEPQRHVAFPGWMKWVVIALVAAVVVAAAIAFGPRLIALVAPSQGSAVAQTTTSDTTSWFVYTSPRYAYRVTFPGQPTETSSTLNVLGSPVQQTIDTWTNGSSSYAVHAVQLFGTVPDGQVQSSLAQAMTDLVDVSGTPTATTLGGAPAAQLRTTIDGQSALVTTVLQQNNLYAIVIVGADSDHEAAFLQSFGL